jgi:secreted trypsin-like serine protease
MVGPARPTYGWSALVRSIRSLFVVFVVSVVAVPWPASPAGAIAHGEDARNGDYRFTVLLTMSGLPVEGGGSRDSSCSGALIAPRWVITAGHCFRDAGGRRVSRTVAERTTATVGRTDLNSRDGREVEVVDAYQADGADVALARLADAVTDIAPIRLATEPPAVGEVLRLTGFGLTADGEPAPATWLQTGQFTVDAVGDAMIETSGRAPRPDTSPCLHDSGGPYFRAGPDGTFVLAAVVSTGPDCPHPGPDSSARTDNLGNWIAGTMAGAETAPLHGRAGVRDAMLVLAGATVPALVLVWVVRRRRGSLTVDMRHR